MYLLIYDDGSLEGRQKIDQELKDSVDDGYLGIINVGETKPKSYFRGEWYEIEGD